MNDKNDKLTLKKRYLDTAKLSQYLSKSKWWIYDRIQNRAIPFIPVCRELRFDLQVINNWMAKKAVRSI